MKHKDGNYLFPDSFYLVFITILILAYTGYILVGNSVLSYHYPVWYSYFFIWILFIVYKIFIKKYKVSPFDTLSSLLVVGVFYYALIYTPIMGVIKYQADDQICKTYRCEIVGMGTSSRDRSLTYKFREHSFKFYSYQPYRGFSMQKSDIDKYYVELVTYEGWKGTIFKKSIKLREK